MTSLTPLTLSLEPMVPGLSAPDILTARGNDPWCHSAVVVNALRTATPFADWEVVTPPPCAQLLGAAPAPVLPGSGSCSSCHSCGSALRADQGQVAGEVVQSMWQACK